MQYLNRHIINLLINQRLAPFTSPLTTSILNYFTSSPVFYSASKTKARSLQHFRSGAHKFQTKPDENPPLLCNRDTKKISITNHKAPLCYRRSGNGDNSEEIMSIPVFIFVCVCVWMHDWSYLWKCSLEIMTQHEIYTTDRKIYQELIVSLLKDVQHTVLYTAHGNMTT